MIHLVKYGWVAALLSCPLMTAIGADPSSGMSDIDHIRHEVKAEPTQAENANSRRSALLRWWRLMWRRGQDMTAFDEVANHLLNTNPDSEANWAGIDWGYAVLEEMWGNPDMIPEVQGEPREYNGEPTDWPYYGGPTKHNTGYSPDPGPSEGKLAWRFPKGKKWNAIPVVDKGRIYLSSPGIDVVAFCLDEETGEVIWRGRQYGERFYGTPRTRYDPVVTENHVLIRRGLFAGNMKVFSRDDGQAVDNPKPTTGAEAESFAYTRVNSIVVLADATTGKDLWAFDTKKRLSGEPQMDTGSVFAAGRGGAVYHFDKATGKVTWTVELNEELQGKLSVGKDHIYAGTRDGSLIALRRGDGSTAWTFDAGVKEIRSRQFFSSALENKGRLYFGSASNQVYSIDTKTGKLLWTYRVDDWVRSRPVIVNGVVYAVTLSSRLYALREGPNSATELWSTFLGRHGVTADLVEGEAGLLAADRNYILHSLSYETGKTRWRQGILDGTWIDGKYVKADYSAALPGTPTIVDDVVYIGGSDGFVHALDVDNGRELWKFEVDERVSGAVSIVNGKAMFGEIGRPTGGFDGTADLSDIDISQSEENLKHGPLYYAVNPKTGALVWKQPGYGYTWIGAIDNDGVMFIGDMSGYVYGVDPETGEKLWSYYTAKDTFQEDKPHDHHKHGWPPGVYCMPVADENNFYVGSWSGYYFAFDQKTGDLRWRTQTGWPETGGGLPDSAAPTLHKDHLYVQKQGHRIAAINIQTGEIEWEWKARAGFLQNGTLAALEDMVYASVTRRVTHIPYICQIYAFSDVTDGSDILWTYREGAGLTAPVVTDDQLIFGSSSGMHLTSLNPRTGALKWRLYTGGEMTENIPAIYGDMLFSVSKNGWLNAVK